MLGHSCGGGSRHHDGADAPRPLARDYPDPAHRRLGDRAVWRQWQHFCVAGRADSVDRGGRPGDGADHRARIAGAHAAIRAIEADRQATPASGEDGSPDADADAAERIVALYRQRIERYQDNSGFAPMPGGVDDVERRLRLLALHAEREEIIRSAHGHGVKEVDQHKLVREIDLQEARYSA